MRNAVQHDDTIIDIVDDIKKKKRKDRIEEIKSKLKRRTPELIALISTVAAAALYAAHRANVQAQERRISIDLSDDMLAAIDDGSFKSLEVEDDRFSYKITSKEN